jgi:hypothetical protein
MPTPSYELSRLDANTFEHLANALALRVLGPGHTGFGPGADGGRDGFFEGTAPYPSSSDRWSGKWYIQSKFLAPHLSKDPQKWLLDRIREELDLFEEPESDRRWPDNWIIATNIEPSGKPQTGSFDRAFELVKKIRPKLAKHFHIWGGRKILDLLSLHPEIGEYYAEFVTSGQVLAKLYAQASDAQAQIEQIVRYLIVTQFNEQQYTKLEQAGSTTDNRPGIQRLFADLPFLSSRHNLNGMAATTLASSLAQNHKIQITPSTPETWSEWQRHPGRARTWFVKGGPGQGKSTLTQYISQIQRAAVILQENGPTVLPQQRTLAEDVRDTAVKNGLWPAVPRLPVIVDLKEFAFWFGQRGQRLTDRMIAFFSETLTNQIGELVQTGTLRRLFSSSRWLFVFDGLDEVPGDVKDAVANEVTHFINDVLVGYGADAAIICTSRPQGYSGQFSNLDAAIVELVSLSRKQALACAEPLLGLDRSESERRAYVRMLREALESDSIAEIMTTPLQAHIMAVIVRDGGKPPERKWQLFSTFYEIIKKREANRNLPDRKLATLLREGDKLLKALHNRLGFELQARAETSQGAVTSLDRSELLTIVREVVSELQDTDIPDTVATLMRATTERLVLVSTPEAGEFVRFDIRPLQEFFAGEYIYQSGETDTFVDRVRTIAGDSHWREVIHFLLSALIENNRKSELAAAITVLVQLDDGGDREARALNRRLARGGIIAARLLQEGVLEQDKRLREQFRSCLVPLIGCIDAADYLSKIKSLHSVQWLIEVLIAVLNEQAEHETIGALITLANIFTDTDSRSEHLRDIVLKASGSYQRFFLEQVEAITPDRKEAPRWLRECALKLLLRGDWWTLGREAVSSAIDIFSGPNSKKIARDCGVHPSIARLIDALLPKPRHLYRAERADHVQVRYGIIEVRYFKPNAELDWKNWSPEVWVALKSSPGILNAVYHALHLVRSPSATALNFFTAAIGGDIQNYRLLPETTQAYFTDDHISASKGKLRAHDLLEKNQPGYLRDITLADTSEERVDWGSLIRKEPWLALYLLVSDGRSARKEFQNCQYQRLLLEHLPPNALVSYAPMWGRLFKLFQPFGSDLRRLALTYSNEPPHQTFFGNGIETFELRLPEEASMLPLVLGALVEALAPVHPILGREAKRPTHREVSKLVVSYVPSSGDLFKIVSDPEFSTRIRAAATILLALHTESTAQSIKMSQKNSLVCLYELADGGWFLPSVALLLNDAIAAGQPGALDAMGALLEASSADFQGRSAVNASINNWREITRAPVKRSGTPELWA